MRIRSNGFDLINSGAKKNENESEKNRSKKEQLKGLTQAEACKALF
jgi:hypothetical protein